MSQKSITLVIVLFTLIVVGMFMYAKMKKTELTVEPVDTEVPDTSVPYPEITRVDAKHYFIDGIHTLVGELNFPTPCDLLETEAVVMESYPEQVQINFTVINNAEMCTQVVTAQRFKVSAEVSQDATFRAVFMGRPIDLNLIPAAERETPDEFELFIKG